MQVFQPVLDLANVILGCDKLVNGPRDRPFSLWVTLVEVVCRSGRVLDLLELVLDDRLPLLLHDVDVAEGAQLLLDHPQILLGVSVQQPTVVCDQVAIVSLIVIFYLLIVSFQIVCTQCDKVLISMGLYLLIAAALVVVPTATGHLGRPLTRLHLAVVVI